MRQSFKDMAAREAHARDSFVADLAKLGEISEAAAVKVASLYLREGIAKMDYGIGRIQIKHGAFLDKGVIQRAVSA